MNFPPVVIECQILRNALREIAEGGHEASWYVTKALTALEATRAVSTEKIVQDRSLCLTTPVEPAGG